MTNLLVNGDFEGGAGRATFNGQAYGEISVPLGWTAFWDETKSRPEMKIIGAVAPYLDPPRVAEGKQAVQWFSFYRDHDAGLYQRVSVPAGATLHLSALAHVWYSQRDDPRKSEYHYDSAPDTWYRFSEGQTGMDVGVGIDPTGGTDWTSPAVVWTWESYYDEPWVLKVEAPDCGPTVTVFLRSFTRWPFKHCDAYWDDAVLEVLDAPDPEPVCRGLPREDYARTVNVIPQDATPERAEDIFAMAWANGRQTVTGSYDDAGIGDLTEKTAVLWDIPEVERSEYVEFYQQYYPGTRVLFEGDDGGAVEPEPPTGGEPTAYPLRSHNLIGLHSGFVRAQTWEYVTGALPTVQKFFSAGDCYLAKQRAPEIITVWRKFVSSLPSNDAPGGARWYVDQYSAEIEDAARALGISTAQLLSGIDAAESYNEMIPTHNLDALKWAVEFDCAFAESLSTIDIVPVLPVLLNGAVGNPHETEVELMLPAAQAAEAYGGFVGYHTYWAANRTDTYIRSGWQYHAGRWMEWDKIFTAHGVYPRYLSTESGICYAPDGWSFDPSSGWKACGSFERYLLDINEYNRRCLEWNASHANRFAGMTLFGYGNWGWDSFELGDGEVILLQKWAAIETATPTRLAMMLPDMSITVVMGDDAPRYRRDLEEYLDATPYVSNEWREVLMRRLWEKTP